MQKLLKYIVLMMILLVAQSVTQAQYVIDKVCKDAVRTYRVDGEPGLTYNWILTDTSGSAVMSSSGLAVSGGSEININWAYPPGIYSLSVEKISKFGCPVDTLGTIEVMPVPVVYAGPDTTICAGKTVFLSHATAINLTPAGLEWTTSGDGSFDDPYLVTPVYTPGPKDLIAGTVKLKITAKSLSKGDGCQQEKEVEITIIPQPKLVVNDPPAACAPNAVDLTLSAVTKGSTIPKGASFSYWEDLLNTVALADPKQVNLSGTYYIRLDVNGQCPDIQPVNVVVNIPPVLVIHDPDPVCYPPTTVDLSASAVTAGSDPTATLSYWLDDQAKIKLVNYKTISSSGIYYIAAASSAGCANIQPVKVEVIQRIMPEFNLPDELCLNSIPPPLPLTSNNGITGTWNYPSISTGTLGKIFYEFTPDGGQCASRYSIIINITNEIIPVFAPIAPLCQGSMPPLLPAISNNGLTGSWSPSSISTASSGTFTYTFTADPGQCSFTPLTMDIQIDPPVVPSFNPIGQVCQFAANPLPSVSTEGIKGTWTPAFSSSTPGITTYTFTPNAGECAIATSIDITVEPQQIPVFAQIGPLCSNDPAPTLPSTSANGISGKWSPAVIDMNNSGTYTFIPDAGQCAIPTFTKMDIVIHRIDISATVTTISKTNPTGSVDLTVTIGSGSYSYSWTGPGGFTSTDPDISGLSLGNYTVIVTDLVTKCTEDKTVTIFFEDVLNVIISSTIISCPGGNDGTATVEISGGTPPYTVLWSTRSSAEPVKGTIATITGLSKDNYFYADVKDAAGNTIRTPFEEIKETTVRYTFASYVATPPVCEGDQGKIDFTFGNGGIIPNSNYDILYDGGQFTNIPIIGNRATVNAFAGTYNNLRVFVKGCPTPAFGPVTLTEPKLNITTSIIQPTCSVNTGTITVSSPAPGVGITYTLTGINPIVAPQTKPTGFFDKLSPGEYHLTIKNALGCISKPLKLTINQQITAIVPLALVTQPKCSPEKGKIEVTYPLGATYEYSKDGGITYQNSPIFTDLDAAIYSMIVREKGSLCLSNIKKETIDPAIALPELATVAITQPTCEVPTGSFTITNVAFGSGYEYSIDGINYRDSKTFSGLAPNQTYLLRVRLKSTGCESVTPVIIDANPLLQVNTTVKQPDCVDHAGKIIVTSPAFNSGFIYSKDGGVNYQDSAIFRNLAPGNYLVVAKQKTASCTTPTKPITIDPIPANPLPPAIKLNPLFDCEESPIQTLNANDGIIVEAGTTIKWYDQASGGKVVASPILKTVGEVKYYAESMRGACTSLTRTEITLAIFSTPKVFGPASPIVQCESVPIQTLDANLYITGLKPGEKLTWFDSAVGGNIVSPFLNTVDTKTVYAEASNIRCTADTRVPVTLMITPTPSAPVWITDFTECEESPIQTLDARNGISAPAPGITINWYDQAVGGTLVASPILNIVGTKTYYAEASILSCINPVRTPVKLTISPIPAPPVWVKDITECEDSPIQTLDARNGIAASAPGTTIKWYEQATGGTPIAAPTLNSVNTKTYYAEASIGNCVNSLRTPVILTINPSPEILVSQNPVEECATNPLQTIDARSYVSVASPMSLIWYDQATGGTPIAAPILDTIDTKTYYAETFNGQCPSPARTGITLSIFEVPQAPVLQISAVPSCKNEHGTINITSPLGSDYEYSIDGGAFQASPEFTNLLSKSYTVRVRNVKTHCESAASDTILPPVPPAPIMRNAYATDCKCFGGDGSINFEFDNVEDGTYVIVYVGSDNKPGQFLNVQVENGLANVKAKAGKYDILAIEANGCTSAEKHSVTILEPPRLSVSAKITEIDLKSGQKGEIDLTITGGTPSPTNAYQIVWEPNLARGFAGATTEDIKNLNDGDYIANITDQNGCPLNYMGTIPIANQPPVATNDDYKAECGGKASGDLLKTDTGFGIDSDPDGDAFYIDTTAIQKPAHGIVTINLDGTFVYYSNLGFTGVDEFQYVIYDVKKNYSTPATVTIHVVADLDGDGVVDEIDPDSDGDGILNVDEVLPGFDWTKTDTDGDGHPNWLDIDSDNDGIVDNVEAQTSAGYIPPTGIDSDDDGVDNAYDTSMGNENIKPLDTDGDGIPDFLDSDSDNDLVPDYIEGHDKNSDGKPDEILLGLDSDFDGLDDGFDTVANNCNNFNSTGSNSPLQDFDHDGMHDWRDDNDDNDEYPTRFEDLNADGNYSNDDTDGDGYPEYLDFGRDCELLIPEAFSPNEDNIHEYFQIYCLESFPDAKIYIFDQLGNLLFEKEHYGNLNVWNSPENAWWDGRTKNRSATTVNGKVTPGTYFYVLKLGNGEVKKSFVFVSY